MNKVINKFKDLNHLLGAISGGLILLASIFISYEVIMRYVFGNAPNWTNDVTRYFLLAIAFVPAAFALIEKAHINVDVLSSRAHGKVKLFLNILSYVVIFIFSSVVVWQTYPSLIRSIQGGWRTQGTFTIPASILYIIIVFGSIFLLITCVFSVIELFVKGGSSDEEKNNELENLPDL